MFLAVMEAASFAKAAERLGMSSRKALRLMLRLEQEPGIRLLNRTTRALSLTEVGRV
jgi:DNA-binding transcriptional LysR family regulator